MSILFKKLWEALLLLNMDNINFIYSICNDSVHIIIFENHFIVRQRFEIHMRIGNFNF